MGERRLTDKKYECIDCGEKKHLVIRYHRGKRCKDCLEKHLEKKKALRKINKTLREELEGE